MDNKVQKITSFDFTSRQQPIRKLATTAMGIQRFDDIIGNTYFYLHKNRYSQ